MRQCAGKTNRIAAGFDALEPRLLFCATSAITADLTSELIAQWTFEDAGAVAVDDVSGQAADHGGTLASGAYSTSNALCGHGGVRFVGGAAEMRVANHSEINLITQGQRSVSIWFNSDNIDIGSRRQFLYEEGGTSRGLSIYLYNGELFAGGWNRVGSESNWDGTWFSTGNITSGGWHHVVLTLDAGATLVPNALNAYLDGQLFGSGDGSQLWGHSGDITFGNGTDTRLANGATTAGTNGFAGWIDDARLYNRALSAHDIAVLSGRFDEGAAITVARAAKLDLVAKAEPVTDVEPTQEPTTTKSPAKPAGIDVLAQSRPIAFPTADEDKAASPDAVIAPEAEAVGQAGPAPPSDSAQSNAEDSEAGEAAQSGSQQHDPGDQQDATANANAAEPEPGQSTAHVDEPKRKPARHKKPASKQAAMTSRDETQSALTH